MRGMRSGEKRSGFYRLAVVAGMLAVCSHALAVPGKIVILRHGEKQDDCASCDVGRERSPALGVRYLGGNTADSVLPSEDPAALPAITLHTLETVSPVANIQGKPVVTCSAVPLPDQSDGEKAPLLNKLARAAARDVLNDPPSNYRGKKPQVSLRQRVRGMDAVVPAMPPPRSPRTA
ncbi:hypothetical protein MCA0069 [Methylococcus capsulatus str. Bath]|uniref:Uncharacterized protein n=1 Tax=Methylococcus capsulatus (strain ATCC 33009 / NCIMB 11132 / Bath) TaxID=243233 RepID=Q60CN6_METCA|nr:hypothetical protein [Methylococcus capsulatus]AAU90780.1 hypothetical protein MCA0069 [Methylococcus capsulatus str. Bath]